MTLIHFKASLETRTPIWLVIALFGIFLVCEFHALNRSRMDVYWSNLEAICKLILALWWPGKFWSIFDLFKAWNSRTRKIPNSANVFEQNLFGWQVMKFYTMVDLGGCKRNFCLDRSFSIYVGCEVFLFVLLKKMAKNVDCGPKNFGYVSAQNLWKEQDYIYGQSYFHGDFSFAQRK